jgi:hypothetical protein
MAQFSSGTPATYTPTASTTTLSHYALTVLTVGQLAKVKMFSWGGDGTSLVGYVSRWTRVNNTPVTAVALLIASSNPGVTPTGTCNTYSGTAPTGVADNNLFKINWNVQGGGGVVVLPIGGEWQVVGGALGTAFNQIGAGNVTGADANLSSYNITWEE